MLIAQAQRLKVVIVKFQEGKNRDTVRKWLVEQLLQLE